MTQKIVNLSDIEAVLNKYAGTSGWAEATAGEIREIIYNAPSASGDAVAEVRCRNGEIFGHIGSRVIRDMLPLGSKLYTTPQPDRVAELEAEVKRLDDMRIKQCNTIVQLISDGADLTATNNKLLDALKDADELLGIEPFEHVSEEAADAHRNIRELIAAAKPSAA